MKISFTFWSSMRDDKDMIAFVAKHDPDYAELMVHEKNKEIIDESMLEFVGMGCRGISLDIQDDAAKEFLLDLMQKEWCYEIFFDDMRKNLCPLFMSRGVDGIDVDIPQLKKKFAISAKPDGILERDHFRNRDSAVQAVQNLMKNAL